MISEYSLLPETLLKVHPTSETLIPEGVRLIGAPLEWSETKGKSIKVAVLDTGRPNHVDIKIKASYNFTDSQDDIDRHGHSTFVSGIIGASGAILGVAPEVEIYTYKVLNDQGEGQWPWLANAIRHAADNGIDVINMSLGGPQGSPDVTSAVQYAYQKGVVLIAAAGNEGSLGVGYPAAYPEVIATAAIDKNKQRGSFSSIGSQVEVAAMGVNVYSTYLDNKYAVLNGTSFASPHIAGAVAILQGKSLIRFGKKLSPEQIRLLLKVYSEDVGAFGPDPEYGFGVFSFGRFEKEEYIPQRHTLEMWIGNLTAKLDGNAIVLDQPPVIDPKSNRTLVPVRFVGESFGAQVYWDGNEQKVTIVWEK